MLKPEGKSNDDFSMPIDLVVLDLTRIGHTRAQPVRSRSRSAAPFIWRWRAAFGRHPDRRRGKCSRNQVSGITVGISTESEAKEYRISHRFDKFAAYSSSRLQVASVGKAYKKQILNGTAR